MKCLGILGGMSWESTQVYYKLLNEQVRAHLGSMHSANILLKSYDFAEIALLQHQNDWKTLTRLLKSDATHLVNAGADAIIIATNTMHFIAEPIQDKLNKPLLHIVDAVAHTLHKEKASKSLLLGTKFTMQSSFYASKLEEYEIETLVPSEKAQEKVHQIIYEELVQGKFSKESKSTIEHFILEEFNQHHIDSVILGCTELPILLESSKLPIPLIDSTKAHVEFAVEFIYNN